MTHFAVVAPAFYSHFQAFQALAGTLIDRGHQVTFFQQADARRWLTDPRIGFHALGALSHPPGSLEAALRRAACSNNPLRLRRVIRDMCDTTRMLCAELPSALAVRQIEALLCDQMEAAGGMVAEGLALPYVSVACALPVNREPHLPLPVMPFAYATDERSQHIFEGSRKVYDWLMGPLSKVLRDASRRLAIEPRDGLHECLSPYAQISQTLPGFDFPRQHPPANFHAVGPLRAPQTEQQGEWPIDPTRPFIFASLGTLQGSRFDLFKRIATASRQLDAQLLIAHCGGLDARQEQRLIKASATWVTDFAPQQWALQQADAVMTHGGLNTVMDAIVARTPMLVMPIAFDQPGVASRVTYAGIGLQLRQGAGAGLIRERLTQLRGLSAEPFERLATELANAGGTSRAADIVEAVVRTGEPVLAGLVP
ncbi:glycosyltransferase [Pseudomonas petrae]|uniref:Glycosyltransferase n=1 Tax=Pseudomonas petrae TaxID=2912190 RepID=A0ABS9I9J1_9PSED|nr:glycosyltransferase [Pseudomonas petrae]MCF7532696.1 glycosyltransferase [Pseudomonas petrae]MCF7538887.1 glycosyltransferase [Pseudomonas petrae]MCF7543696.1 glycosyltransferase [Pseudomonas petrae]MCF7557069.1 glycosyltransferase [Pseudomonas petrae]